MNDKTFHFQALLPASLALCLNVFAPSAFAQNTAPGQGNAPGALEPREEAEELAEEAREELPDSFPRFSYGIAIELEDDYTFSATDSAAEFNNLYPTVEGEFALEFWEGTGFFSTVVLEQVVDPTDDSAFQDVGLYAEELYAAATFDALEVKGGKFDPAFGAAFDTAPGVFGTTFAEDYELTEMIGGNLSYGFEAMGGEHAVSGAFFFADRTVLSNSAFKNRGRVHLDDGGPANTSAPKSFAIALEGAFDALAYNAGVNYLAAGEGTPNDQTGFVLGAEYGGIQVGPGDLAILGETAYLVNAEGEDADAFYLTTGVAYGIDDFTLSAVYGLREFNEGGSTDQLATTSIEYEITDGLVAALGYSYTREENENAHTVGILLAYEFGGGFSFADF
ncbi:hypothetical protein KHP62_13710 [Rhodobacteraceae bacterium NNCM2]|nr:hypothetical protein [Coraliihabitans acroporae]